MLADRIHLVTSRANENQRGDVDAAPDPDGRAARNARVMADPGVVADGKSATSGNHGRRAHPDIPANGHAGEPQEAALNAKSRVLGQRAGMILDTRYSRRVFMRPHLFACVPAYGLNARS
jgi:hypothetical protein